MKWLKINDNVMVWASYAYARTSNICAECKRSAQLHQKGWEQQHGVHMSQKIIFIGLNQADNWPKHRLILS